MCILEFTRKSRCKNRRANSGANSGPNGRSFFAQLLIVDFEIKDTNMC